MDGREALARRLRAERRRDEAKEVHALRKPSRAAWAINHVAREEPQLAAEAVAAGDALREAQLALAGSGGPDALRAAASAQRAAVDRFSQAARETLAGAGLSGEDLLGRIGETLLAAATDPDLAERVGAGRVVKEQAPVGFGALAAGPGPLVPATSKRGKSAARSKDRPDARAARAADEEARRRTEAAREEEEHRRARRRHGCATPVPARRAHTRRQRSSRQPSTRSEVAGPRRAMPSTAPSGRSTKRTGKRRISRARWGKRRARRPERPRSYTSSRLRRRSDRRAIRLRPALAPLSGSARAPRPRGSWHASASRRRARHRRRCARAPPPARAARCPIRTQPSCPPARR